MFCCGKDEIGMKDIENESKPMIVKDDMGREIFWEDIGRPDGE